MLVRGLDALLLSQVMPKQAVAELGWTFQEFARNYKKFTGFTNSLLMSQRMLCYNWLDEYIKMTITKDFNSSIHMFRSIEMTLNKSYS